MSNVISIEYLVSRGKNSGEILEPKRNKLGLYTVSKTRFKRDQLYVQTLDEVYQKLQSGYRVRVSAKGIAASLVKFDSVAVRLSA